MRFALRLAAGAAAVATALLTAPTPAHADGVFIEVNPSTIQAGFQVGIRASCGGDELNSAKAKSDAFGTVTLNPDDKFLTGSTTIPSGKSAHGYTVKLYCPSRQTATTTLWVIGHRTHHHGPDTGGGALADHSSPIIISAGVVAVGAGVGLSVLARRRRTQD